jgi:ribulose-bisphosphate carboxylase large chain
MNTPSDASLRFRVVYRLIGDEPAASELAHDLCVEQTVEFPEPLIPEGPIRDTVLGRVERLEPAGDGAWQATISYPAAATAFELTQLLNVVFGNYSLKPGVRVERLDLPEALLAVFGGPRFGPAGLRELLGVPDRPLLSTALKPMGLSAAGLADLAYQLALGGIDIIKDDHGLSDQPYAPFAERVARCAEAVERANRSTGLRCIYVPNVTAPGTLAVQRARQARAAGAGRLLIAPGLAGFGTMAELAADPAIGLPILSHPAFQGSFVAGRDSGISHYALFGQLARLAGADASIYPNYGGRFAFTVDECRSIAAGCAAPMGPIRPALPAPGGGMSLARVPELRDLYGREVIFLVGGGLHTHGPDLVANCRYFRGLAEQLA